MPGYRVLGLSGRGGFGIVLAALRDSDGLRVAIKVASGEPEISRPRLLGEVAALRAVGSPHVPAVYASGVTESGAPYFVMEHLALPTLAGRLAELESPMAEAELVTRSGAILDALEAVHRAGFIHRDLKPENVFFAEAPPHAKLIDLGLTALIAAHVSEATPSIAGTAEYMSPEQCEARADVDVRADIYALGIVLYEMAAGKTPFWGSAADVKHAHLVQRPPRLPQATIARALEEVILSCLAKDRDRRFASVGALRSAIEDALRQSGRPAPLEVARAAASAAAGRTRRSVGLVFFESSSDAAAVQGSLMEVGGRLAHASGGRYVGVFEESAGGHPVRRALGAATSLFDRGLLSRALIDLAAVAVRQSADGARSFLSPLFGENDRFLADGVPHGVFLTHAAGQTVPETRVVAAEGRADIVQALPSSRDPGVSTIMQLGAGPLVGREEVLRELVGGARAAMDDRTPTVVTVIADAGLGKSHLFATLAHELRGLLPKPQVIDLRAAEPLAAGGRDTLRLLLRECLDVPERAPADGGSALLVDRVGPEAWPAVALTLGWLLAEAPELASLRAVPGLLRASAVRAAGEVIRRLAGAQPVAIVLDDAHFADRAALDALAYATLEGTRLPLWVCLLCRPAFASANPFFADRSACRRSITLPPLDSASAVELCRRLLLPAENVPEKAIERLIARTQGIPLLLVELVRSLKRDGLVRRHTEGEAFYIATDEMDHLPDLPLLEWLAERELGALPPDLAAHARLLATLGAEVAQQEVEGVLTELERAGAAAEYPLDGAVGIERLRQSGIVVAHRGERVGFRHALVREAIARSVPAQAQANIHRAAFRFFRDAAADAQGDRPGKLALHASRSGLADEACTAYLDLAERARGRHAYLEAEIMYSRALEHMGNRQDARTLITRQGRGLMRYRLDRYEDALGDLEAALAIAMKEDDPEGEIELLLDQATVLDWMAQYRRSQRLVEKAQELAAEVRSRSIGARLCMARGRSLWRFGEWAPASTLLFDAVTRAEGLGDAGYETLVVSLMMLGFVLAAAGRIDEAERTLARVISICESRGDRLHLSSVLNNRRTLWIARKDSEKAIRDQLRYMELGKELGIIGIEYIGNYNLAELHYQLGELDAAWPHAHRALEIEHRRFGASAKPLAALLQARMHAFAGNEPAARALVEDIHERQGRAHADHVADAMFFPSEEVLLSMVDLATREASDAEWDALRERADRSSVEQELIEVVELRGRAALRHGRPEQAVAILKAALEVAARIPNIMEERIRRALPR